MLDENFLLTAAIHAHLLDVKVRRLVRREQNIIMRGVLTALELIWRDVTTEMIIATGGQMAGAEHLFILNV